MVAAPRVLLVCLAALTCAPGCRILGVGPPCEKPNDCPDVDACVEGVCVARTEAGEGEGEGAAGDGEGEGEGEVPPACVVAPIDPAVCDGPDAVADGFDGNVASGWVDDSGSGSSAETSDGHLELQGSDAQVRSRAAVFLRDGSVTVELGAVDAQHNADFRLVLRAGDPESDVDSVSLGAQGAFSCDVSIDGDDTASACGPYDPGLFAWRIREAAGTLFFEVSSDGSNFDVRRQIATPAFFDEPLWVALVFTADSDAGIELDAVNGGPQGPICNLGDLRDSFCDGAPAPLFSTIAGSLNGPAACSLAEGDQARPGLTAVVQPGDDDTTCFYRSVADYELPGPGLHIPVDLSGILDAAGHHLVPGLATSFSVYDAADDESLGLELREDGGSPAVWCGVLDQRLDQLVDGNKDTIPPALLDEGIAAVHVGYDVDAGTVTCTVESPTDSFSVVANNLDMVRFDPGFVTLGMFAFDPLPRQASLRVAPFAP